MRCASPPESVAESRSSVRYSSPTSFRNFSRCRISTRTLSAIAASSGDKLQRSKELLRLGDVHASTTSAIVLPPTRMYSASGRRRDPPQSGHRV